MASSHQSSMAGGVGMNSAAGSDPAPAQTAGHGANSSASQGPPVAPLGRPPLPRLRSLPTSVASSREGSPRSAVSEAPSMATQAMARLASYRAGARTFRPDRSQRLGLSTGDVVAFRVKGVFLAAVPVPQPGAADPDAVLHALAPVPSADSFDHGTHMEVIRQGQWVGFRCQLAGDRLLQARRRGAHRLAFFSPNLGTWEQWEVPEASALDSLPWASVTVTLRNRRLPACELAVEMVRVGSVAMAPAAAVTPRSLAAPAAAAAAPEEEPVAENPNIRRMSGLLVHEWLSFVEREKRLRSAIEARMEAAVEDAVGLREWAAAQVEGVRRDVEEEVELLLAALSRKSAALEDAHARLETRVRWGVALLEAKKAAVLGRRVLAAWRASAARAKYCRHVAAKLQERAAIRTAAGALDAWAAHCAEQRVRRARLRAAVRRMAALKMCSVLGAWRHSVAARRAEDAAEAAATGAAVAHLRAWQLRRVVGAWRERSRRAGAATRLLHGMAARADTRAVAAAFSAWRERAAGQKAGLKCLKVRLAANRRREALGGALDAWRVAVDDTFGGQMQVVHAQRVISRRRGVRALQAWRGVAVDAAAAAARARQVDAYARRRAAARALAAWADYAAERREARDTMVGFVHARAERRMRTALFFWRCYSAWQRHAAAAVAHAGRARAVRTASAALATWQEEAAAAKVARHRVAVCQRRQRAGLAARALAALRQHAAETAADREAHRRAAAWHAGRLQARALWVLEESAHRRVEFCGALRRAAAAAADRRQLKHFWEVWQQEVGREKAAEVAVYRFQARREWHGLRGAFTAWRGEAEATRREGVLLARGTARLGASRLRWALAVWRSVAAAQAEEAAAAAFGARRLAGRRLAACFSAWRGHAAWAAAVRDTVEEAAGRRRVATLTACVDAWAYHTVTAADQAAGVRHMVARRAAALQAATLAAWRQRAAEKGAQRAALRRGAARIARLRCGAALAAWRQATDDGHGERQRLGTVGLTLAVRHQELVLGRLFAAWRGRAAEVAAGLASFEARRAADGAAVLRCAFASWGHLAEGLAVRRDRLLAAAEERRAVRARALTFAAWRYQANASSRNAIVVLHRVERAATAACRGAFDAWRAAAAARRARRVALVRAMQRWNAGRLGAAFGAWRGVAAQAVAAREELKRCQVRKRVAFHQFKQWYWDSFDEDLQATLRSMFEMEAEEGALALLEGPEDAAAAAAPRSATPIRSLLASPIRRELEQARREASGSRGSSEGEDGFAGRLAARVRGAVAAAAASPAPPLRPAPGAAEVTGSAVLAPLVDWFGPDGFFDPGLAAAPPLSPLPEGDASDGEEAAAAAERGALAAKISQYDREDLDDVLSLSLSPYPPGAASAPSSSAGSTVAPTPAPGALSPFSPAGLIGSYGGMGTAAAGVRSLPLAEAKTPWSALRLGKGAAAAVLDEAVTPRLADNPLADIGNLNFF